MTDDERDAWIAEHVMHEPVSCTGDLHGDDNGYATTCDLCGYRRHWIDMDSTSEHPRLIPRYTRDLNAAWLVIERLGKRPGFDAFEIETYPGALHTLRLTWTHTDGQPRLYACLNVETGALAEAICRAAWHALQETRE